MQPTRGIASTTSIAILAGVLIAGLGADLTRRLTRIDQRVTNSNTPGFPSGRRPQTGHEATVLLTEFAGGLSHVTLRVSSGLEQVAELELLEIDLGGGQAQETNPRIARTDDGSPLELPLVFRDVAWRRKAEPPHFRAPLRFRCRIRYAQEPAGQGRVETRTTHLEVDSGAAYTALLATFGAPR